MKMHRAKWKVFVGNQIQIYYLKQRLNNIFWQSAKQSWKLVFSGTVLYLKPFEQKRCCHNLNKISQTQDKFFQIISTSSLDQSDSKSDNHDTFQVFILRMILRGRIECWMVSVTNWTLQKTRQGPCNRLALRTNSRLRMAFCSTRRTTRFRETSRIW